MNQEKQNTLKLSSYQKQPLLLVLQPSEDVSPYIPENLPVIDEENNDETNKSHQSRVQRGNTGGVRRSHSRNFSSLSVSSGDRNK